MPTMPRLFVGTSLWPIVLLLAAVAPLGAGCVMKSTHQETLAKLRKCQDAETACLGREKSKTERIDELEQSIAKCSKERDEIRQGKESSEKTLADVQTHLQTTRAELDDLRKQRAEAEKRLQAFKNLASKFQRMIDTGKIKVLFRGGRMILKLPAGILFPSGRATLSREGEAALAEVAAILKDFPDRHFLIAGHTDNV
ncbi:MAG: hypothetical protein V2A73_20200, partial [Pseudomonadota bacterium]